MQSERQADHQRLAAQEQLLHAYRSWHQVQGRAFARCDLHSLFLRVQLGQPATTLDHVCKPSMLHARNIVSARPAKDTMVRSQRPRDPVSQSPKVPYNLLSVPAQSLCQSHTSLLQSSVSLLQSPVSPYPAPVQFPSVSCSLSVSLLSPDLCLGKEEHRVMRKQLRTLRTDVEVRRNWDGFEPRGQVAASKQAAGLSETGGVAADSAKQRLYHALPSPFPSYSLGLTSARAGVSTSALK